MRLICLENYSLLYQSIRKGEPQFQKLNIKNMQKLRSVYKHSKKIIFLLAIAIIVTATVTDDDNKYFELSKNIEIFANLYKEINTNYVDDTDPSSLMRVGIDAMLASLDPFTNYISEGQIEGYRIATTGKYGGIGATTRTIGDFTVVTGIQDGFAAEKAGLKIGDVIVSVDNKSTIGKKADEVAEFTKGSPGSKVVIQVERPQADGSKQTIDIELEREKIVIPNVPYYGMVNDEIGYITLTTFTQKAGANVRDALIELRKNDNLKGVIFDLRGNGGGLLNEAVEVANVFIDDDELVVSTRGKVKEWDRDFKTSSKPVDLDIPLVVLTDKGSASASEIVSGVIQDLDRGVVIGQKSYGKGLVQNTVDVGYNSRVKVTIAKYYIPSGRCIQAVSYKNGEPIEIPDNEKAKFKTRNGRTVLDGGGIMPDIKLPKAEQANITKSLLSENIIFDFATLYALKHPTIKPAKEFTLSDAEYEVFVEFVKDRKHTYETESEKSLNTLEEKAKSDHYFKAIAADLTAMRQKIEADKANDIYTHKNQIVKELEKEIIARYYFEKGQIELRLQNDAEVEKAIEVLGNMELYNTTLQKQ